MRALSDGRDQLDVPGATIREVIDNLERECPGIKERLCADGRIKPGIAVAVDGVMQTKKLGTPVQAASEVHFVPAISGGAARPARSRAGPSGTLRDRNPYIMERGRQPS